jgi:peptidoglycan-associated lipoprotein
MCKGMRGFLMLLCCGALLASGCAKKELVKGEGETPPAAAPVPAIPEQEQGKPPVKEEMVQEQPVKEAPSAAKEETMPVKAAELETVYFDFDSFVLTAPSRTALAKNADYLMKNSSGNIQIQGNCDERGSDEYNLALGEKRAKAAMNYLVTLGVPESRLSIISYGKEKPADPGHDEAAWAKNRRDDFAILK